MNEDVNEESLNDQASKFQKIFNHIANDLDVYEHQIKEIDSKFTEKQKELVQNSLTDLDARIRKSAQASYNQYRVVEDLEYWISNVISKQQTKINGIGDSTEDDSSMAAFILQFYTNKSTLRSLQNDLILKLRKTIKEKESQETQRMKVIKKNLENELEIRKGVLSQLDKECRSAEEKYNEVIKENDHYSKEMLRADEQLAIFNSSDSFMVVQQARKSRLIENDWVKRISSLHDQINAVSEDIEKFKHPEQYLPELKKTSAAQDLELNKLETQYSDDMALVTREISATMSTHKSLEDIMMKDLKQARDSLLKEERRSTAADLKRAKIYGERFISSYNKTRTANQKAIEKNFKRREITKEEVTKIVTEDHMRDVSEMKAILTNMENELREIIERQYHNVSGLFEFKMSALKSDIEKKHAALVANKERIQEKLLDKSIELDSVERQLAPTESLYNDLLKYYNEKTAKKQEMIDKIKNMNERARLYQKLTNDEIEKCGNFISNAKYITVLLRKKLKESMRKSETRTDLFKEMSDTKNKDDFGIMPEEAPTLPINTLKKMNPEEIKDFVKEKRKKMHQTQSNKTSDTLIKSHDESAKEDKEPVKANQDKKDDDSLSKATSKTRNDDDFSFTYEEEKETEELCPVVNDAAIKERNLIEEESDSTKEKSSSLSSRSKKSIKNESFEPINIKSDVIRSPRIIEELDSDESSQRSTASRSSIRSKKEDENLDTNDIRMPIQTRPNKSVRRSTKKVIPKKQSEKMLPLKLNNNSGNTKVFSIPRFPKSMNVCKIKIDKHVPSGEVREEAEKEPIILSVRSLLGPSSKTESYEFGMLGEEAKLKKSTEEKAKYRFILKSTDFTAQAQRQSKCKNKNKYSRPSVKVERVKDNKNVL